MQETIQHRRSDGAVVIENRGPVFEWFVGRQDNGSALVTLADDLEQQIGAPLVNRQVTDFIESAAAAADTF